MDSRNSRDDYYEIVQNLFITTNKFWIGVEPSHEIILGLVLVKNSNLFKLCCKYVLQVPLKSILNKEKDRLTFYKIFNGWYKLRRNPVFKKVFEN